MAGKVALTGLASSPALEPCGGEKDMIAAADVRERVAFVVMQALCVDREAVIPSARLVDDLGAEPGDLLDIAFRLGGEFGIKAPRDEPFTELVFRGGTGILRDGRVTPEGLGALRLQMPYADLGHLANGGRLGKLTDLLTVDLLVRYVAWKLGEDHNHVPVMGGQ